MKLKLSTLLLSTLITPIHFAATGVEQDSQKETGDHSSLVCVNTQLGHNSLACVTEFRARRAALESRLSEIGGEKLKVFTPQIFAEMLSEGIAIGYLGLEILEKLPELISEYNQRLKNLESRIKSKNALIPWRELKSFYDEFSKYKDNFWNEFVFDFDQLVRQSSMQSQVKAAHEQTLSESKEFSEFCSQLRSRGAIPESLRNEFVNLCYSCKDKLNRLLQFKFSEEIEDTLREAVKLFKRKISAQNVALLSDVYPNGYFRSYPGVYIERYLEQFFTTGQLPSVFEVAGFKLDDFVIGKEKIAEYVSSLENLSDWMGLSNYAKSIYELTQNYERIEWTSPIVLKEGVDMDFALSEQIESLERTINAALVETFAWLMTQ